MRSDEISAVCHGCNGCYLLDCRYVISLTEGINREVYAAEALFIDGRAFAGEIYACFFIQSEIAEVIYKRGRSDALCEHHHSGVAGLLKRTRKIERAVSCRLVAFYRA